MRVELVPEGGGWSAFIPGLPVAAEGKTLDEAVAELADALREYAQDWHDHLRHAANHRANQGVVERVTASDDARLRDWLVAAAR